MTAGYKKLEAGTPRIEPHPFGGGAFLFQLRNVHGMQVDITNLGASITSFYLPDREGSIDDIVLGYDTAEEYLAGDAHLGAVAGRVAGRINKGRAVIGDTTYQLTQNNGNHHLHGGTEGFNKKLFSTEISETDDSATLKLTHISPDGDEGYPGTLVLSVIYSLSDDNTVSVRYEAVSDADTLCNPTQHSYFNLGGHGTGSLDGHTLMLNSDRMVVLSEDFIPTGEIVAVRGTPMDFQSAKPITQDIDSDFPAIKAAGGFDHQWVLADVQQSVVTLAAEVTHAESGRVMQVETDAAGIVFYTSNMMAEGLKGKRGASYGRRHGFCLEAQGYQDASNHPHFPTTLIKAGESWSSETRFIFKW